MKISWVSPFNRRENGRPVKLFPGAPVGNPGSQVEDDMDMVTMPCREAGSIKSPRRTATPKSSGASVLVWGRTKARTLYPRLVNSRVRTEPINSVAPVTRASRSPLLRERRQAIL